MQSKWLKLLAIIVLLNGSLLGQETKPQNTVSQDIAKLGSSDESKKNDPTGTWTWKQEINGNEIAYSLVLSWKDQKLTGTFKANAGNTSSDIPAALMEPVGIADGKLDGDKISFSVTRKFNENEFKSSFEGVLKGDKITGNRKLNFGGENRDSEWLATRELSVSDVIGKWTIRLNTPQGEFEEGINFSRDGEKLKGTFHSSVFGEFPLTDIKIEGTKLLFSVKLSNNDFEIIAKYVTEPKGNKISGAAHVNLGGQDSELKFDGKRVESPK